MNIQKTINIILALCLLLLIIKMNPLDKNDMNDNGSSTLEIIHQRKSVRNYTEKKVSKEQLETLVKAAMAAPTAVNKQPWAFIAINDRATLDHLGYKLPYAKMTKTASAAIIVCGDLSKALEGWEQAFWIQDCSAASQNILLAAEAMGLGAVWTAAYPAEDRMAIVRDILNLPENIIPLNVIPVGYPKGIEKPKDKWKPENLHWDKW
ncbi:nitroreductase family protein [uncultured Draconibacterium sp.]|uniref:nitroreductase family protein n=1 Tax=uncultured Draconibacterium sp. TaxID=1573823 RepID=UPI0029C028DE|nr:nitroreductase family protein [uncultured Draconibacterium sp.]